MKIKHCSNGEDTLIIEPNDMMHPLKCLDAKLIVKKYGNKPKQSSIPFFHKKDSFRHEAPQGRRATSRDFKFRFVALFPS